MHGPSSSWPVQGQAEGVMAREMLIKQKLQLTLTGVAHIPKQETRSVHLKKDRATYAKWGTIKLLSSFYFL